MTTQEYLHGLTQDRFLRQELNLASVVSSSLGAEAASCVQGIVLNSVISEAVTVPPDTIVEYSHVQSEVHPTIFLPATSIESFTITEKAPTMAFSWLKAHTSFHI